MLFFLLSAVRAKVFSEKIQEKSRFVSNNYKKKKSQNSIEGETEMKLFHKQDIARYLRTVLLILGGCFVWSAIDANMAHAGSALLNWGTGDFFLPKPVDMPQPHPKFVLVPIAILMFVALVFYVCRQQPVVQSIVTHFYTGRIDRTEFLFSAAGLGFVCIFGVFIYFLSRTNLEPIMPICSTLALAYEMSLTVRRSHDIDLNWKKTLILVFLTLIPGPSFIPLLYLATKPGTRGENQFGPSPLEEEQVEVVLMQRRKYTSFSVPTKIHTCVACNCSIDRDSNYCKYCGAKQPPENIEVID